MRVHQVGPHVLEHLTEPPYLPYEGRARRAGGVPVPYVGAEPAHGGGEGAVRAGDRHVQTGRELGSGQVRHHTGDPAVHGLGQMQDPRPGVGD